MSNIGWEKGTIKLPSAEFARLRKAMQDADRASKEKSFELTQEFWKGLTRKEQTDPAAYKAAFGEFFAAKRAAAEKPVRGLWGSGPSREISPEDVKVIRDAQEGTSLRWGQDKPARVLRSDMDYPTNRTTRFQVSDGSISFNKDQGSVEWYVHENNHAVDRAHGDPLSRAFFRELGTVKWTRGTGGVFTGNDEYNQDNRDSGGGANYVTTAYGPLGAELEPRRCQPYTDSKGKRVTRDNLMKMAQDKFQAEMNFQRKLERQVKGASGAQPRGHNGHAGQFTYSRHSEPTFKL